MTEETPRQSRLKQVRVLLWALAGLGIAVFAVLELTPASLNPAHEKAPTATMTHFGGPFTLVGGDGKPFDSAKLRGKPYAIYFGFTRCGDVCPMTLSRLVQLRRQSGGDDAFRIVFVTIDPDHDGPKEVGRYAGLFNAPIIGLTGSQAQIDAVKKQYGIFAEPEPHAAMGKEMSHTATVLLFDRDGRFAATITPDEPDPNALTKIRPLVG